MEIAELKVGLSAFGGTRGRRTHELKDCVTRIGADDGIFRLRRNKLAENPSFEIVRSSIWFSFWS